jgi:hypothetical protein
VAALTAHGVPYRDAWGFLPDEVEPYLDAYRDAREAVLAREHEDLAGRIIAGIRGRSE